jgi:hypothetical protein
MTIPSDVQAAHAKYQEAHTNLMAYRVENSAVLDTWEEMLQEYNSTVETMKLAYQKAAERDDGISKACGNFRVSRRRSIDVKKLRELLYLSGASESEIASIISTSYTALKDPYDKGVASGIITPEIAENVETYTVTVTAPKALSPFTP